MITKLVNILTQVVNDPALQPKPDGTTYCNIAVHKVGKVMGFNKFEGMLANQIAEYCKNMVIRINELNTIINFSKEGRWILAVYAEHPHGHVASIFPHDSEYSGSWKKDVPFVANVGKHNGIMKASKAFLKEPEYYLVT